jgi:hypothetical protein
MNGGTDPHLDWFVLWVQTQRLVEVVEGLFVQPQVVASHSAAVKCLHVGGVLGQSQACAFSGPGVVSELQVRLHNNTDAASNKGQDLK